MKKLISLVALFSLSVSAQDAQMTLIEADIFPVAGEVTVQPDGGCMLLARSRVQFPSIEPYYVRAQYPFNGARCTQAKDAIVTATKKDMRSAGVAVGDGGVP